MYVQTHSTEEELKRMRFSVSLQYSHEFGRRYEQIAVGRRFGREGNVFCLVVCLVVPVQRLVLNLGTGGQQVPAELDLDELHEVACEFDVADVGGVPLGFLELVRQPVVPFCFFSSRLLSVLSPASFCSPRLFACSPYAIVLLVFLPFSVPCLSPCLLPVLHIPPFSHLQFPFSTIGVGKNLQYHYAAEPPSY